MARLRCRDMELVTGSKGPFDRAGLAIVVLAAGWGERYGRPKQFEELTPGRRLVDVAVETAMAVSDRILLALPPGIEWDGTEVEAVVEGGRTRVETTRSVVRALEPVPDVIIVHDAAHPLATGEMMVELVTAVREGADAAVPVLPLVDVVKRLGAEGDLKTVGRDGLVLAQAPMAFASAALLDGLATQSGEVWEDSMLVELAGGRVVACSGSPRNVHVVSGDDLEIARALEMSSS